MSGASEFNWFSHFILPIGTSIVLLYSLYKSFAPCPASPYNWSPGDLRRRGC